MATTTTKAMDQTNSPQEEETPLTRVDVTRHMVDYYFGIIDPKQWAFLLKGNPDDKTRYILAELLMDLMDLMLITQPRLSEEEMRGLKPWERLASSLGEALPQTLPQSLIVPDKVFRKILDSLRIIVYRVAAVGCVKCMLLADNHPKPYAQYRTAFLRMVKEMVNCTIKMLCNDNKRLMCQHQRLHLKLSLVTSKLRLPENKEHVESRTPGVNNNDIPESLEVTPEPDLSQAPDVTDVTPVDVSVPSDTNSVSAFALEDEQDPRAKEKTFVSRVTEKIISRALRKSRTTSSTSDSLQAIHQRLYTKIWEEVQSQGLNINPDKLRDMDKGIFNDTCKQLRCSKSSVWTRMVSVDPPVEDIIMTSFTKHVKRSEEPGAIRRFFTALGRAFCRPTASPTVLVS
ncbi:uncharacterized protein LOC125014618 [Mugil cephalus]|uniref:uncharacterized protein LOC125014618 n=1 Tax=Mugil cephalus TaxID=48193 RepID=UPI001FB701D7|nr:uncharacterized protein LOC125014618 [Mugil cephalus]